MRMTTLALSNGRTNFASTLMSRNHVKLSDNHFCQSKKLRLTSHLLDSYNQPMALSGNTKFWGGQAMQKVQIGNWRHKTLSLGLCQGKKNMGLGNFHYSPHFSWPNPGHRYIPLASPAGHWGRLFPSHPTTLVVRPSHHHYMEYLAGSECQSTSKQSIIPSYQSSKLAANASLSVYGLDKTCSRVRTGSIADDKAAEIFQFYFSIHNRVCTIEEDRLMVQRMPPEPD